MMKLHSSQPWRNCCTSKLFRALFFSTNTLSSSPTPQDSLFRRVCDAGGDLRTSVAGVLDQWLQEGRKLKNSDLHSLIRQLRKYRRFNHALQLFDWMRNKGNQEVSIVHIAIQLHLISKVHGMEEAEKYFSSINESSRDHRVYGELLNCYVYHRNLEKAEETMQKMLEARFMKTALPFNNMLNFYAQLGKREKLDALVKKMEAMRVAPDKFTYTIRMSAYAATSDITNMEELLLEMEANPLITVDWRAHYGLANGYLKAGLSEKSITMLKRSEQLILGDQRRFAYECLITSYAALGNKDEVYRVWNLYTKLPKRFISGYCSMLSSLIKLDDIEGAEKILKEWESGDTFFDFKIPNLMISGYRKKGLMDKAEAYISRLMESGKKEPPASTWDRLASGYHANGQTMKAVETMKKAISASKRGWKPNYHVLAACLEFLKTNENVEVAEEIVRLLRERDIFSVRICDGLVDYVHSKTQTSSALDQLRLDGQMEKPDHASDQDELDTTEVKYEEASDGK